MIIEIFCPYFNFLCKPISDLRKLNYLVNLLMLKFAV